jgi:hypothetical protein
MTDLQVDELLVKFDTLIALITQAFTEETNYLMKRAQVHDLETTYTKAVIDSWRAEMTVIKP